VYGTACLDTASGKVLWQRRDVHCDHFRGPGSSPILFGDLLIFHMDGIDVQYVIALDKTTGRTVWKTDRSIDLEAFVPDLRKAYSTPTVIEAAGRTQLLSTGAQGSYAYDPATGKELWRVTIRGFSNVARPLFGGGLVLVNSGFGRAQLWAVRPDGQGDVTDTHVAWRATRGIPAKPTPVLVDDLIYMADDRGVASCLELATGETVWQERLGGQFSASPIYADGRIYFFSHDDEATVIRPGRTFQPLAANHLDAGCMASPAVVGNALIVRTKTHLYRIEETSPAE
jgi:outer membrane protein assembly factor BamB